jgi:sporulation protein YlmC with PRC-barrel domain
MKGKQMVVPDEGASRALCRYLGRRVHSTDGRTLGVVADVLADARSGAVQWLVVRVAGMRSRYRTVPVNVSIEVRGRLVVPTSRHMLLAGPPVELGVALTSPDELRLRAHWTTH